MKKYFLVGLRKPTTFVFMKEITPADYAQLYGTRDAKPQYIQRLLKEGTPLPFVKEVKKFGRFYILVVPDDIKKSWFKDLTKNEKKLSKLKSKKKVA